MTDEEGAPERPRLVAGTDYQATYRNFIEMFPDDDACLGYAEALRWPEDWLC